MQQNVVGSVIRCSCLARLAKPHAPLFIGHRRAGRTSEGDDFKALEADFAAPFPKIRAGKIKGIPEFDEHVQRHEQALDVLAPRIVNERFDGHERATGRQRVVGGANEVHLLLQIPVVENHAHGDDVGLRQRVFEEIAGGCDDAVFQSGGGDVLLGDGFDFAEVERGTFQVRMSFSHFNGKQAGRAPDVAKRLEFRKVTFLGKRLEVDAREAGHRAHELFQTRQVGVELLEHALLAVLDFILRAAGAKRFRQIIPELEQPGVEHDENAADVAWAFLVKEQRAFRCIEVFRGRPVAVPAEEFHRHERIEKVRDGARVQAQFSAQFVPAQTTAAKLRKQAELDGCQQYFGRPETKGGLQNRSGIVLRVHNTVHLIADAVKSEDNNSRSEEVAKIPTQGLFRRDSLLLFAAFVNIAEEIQKRRTFAIISHPDAGKTTLTEKLLLYGGAVQLAGSVTARKNQRATTSDWMELEKKRGISISSTVLQFDYDGYRINLLDTPGHKDFSEDTYRVLTAVDSVVMVIDSAKGIEPQTRKLFEVCRQRRVPIFTFMNKCDRPMKNPLELLDELERVLGIGAFPVNWPIGNGFEFQGVYDRHTQKMHLFERTIGGQYRAPVQVGGLHDEIICGRLDDATFHRTVEELEMLEHAGHEWDDAAVLAEKTTPVFFGSASNNFGVQLLLDGFLKHAPGPKGRFGVPPFGGGARLSSAAPTNGESAAGEDTCPPNFIAPEHPAFSGFIFKIQANMDPKHRDRIAFVRVCSGKFERDMTVYHSRSEKKVRLSSSHKIFGNERETVNEAFPGDVIGLVGHDGFGIGDTLTTDPKINYREIPLFTPEAFSYLHNPNTAKFKQFRQGLDQLLQEGVIQALYLRNSSVKTPLLAAVGPLQFEVVQYRLESEYGAESRLESTPWTVVRWLPANIKEDDLDALSLPTGARIAYDIGKNLVVLFVNEWSSNYFAETNKGVALSALPVPTARE